MNAGRIGAALLGLACGMPLAAAPATSVAPAAPTAALAPAAPAASVADAAALQRGARIYTRCAACHAIESNRTGPQHCGLFGRHAGTAPGYDTYSKAMRSSQFVWDEKTLNLFLENPMKVVPGTTMGYAGVKDPTERADLIKWLREATQAGKTCRLATE